MILDKRGSRYTLQRIKVFIKIADAMDSNYNRQKG